MRVAIPNSLYINDKISISLSEIEFSAVRAQGPGGQHVNKVNTAIELRFAIASSSLPGRIKSRLFTMSDQRINAAGVIVIKCSSHRSQIRNKEEAQIRLKEMILKANHVPKVRRATKPTYGSVKRRLAGKNRRSEVKSLRGRVKDTDD